MTERLNETSALLAHFRAMQEACANYLEPTTYFARHPDLGRVGGCSLVREFSMPHPHASERGAAETNARRDKAFIRDMIYMLDGPEQRDAEASAAQSAAEIERLRDGYATAFYEIAGMLGFNASPEGPAHVWEHRMRPRLQAIMEAVEALEEAGWHIKLMAGDIKNPLQKRMADRWVAEARTAAAKARGEA